MATCQNFFNLRVVPSTEGEFRSRHASTCHCFFLAVSRLFLLYFPPNWSVLYIADTMSYSMPSVFWSDVEIMSKFSIESWNSDYAKAVCQLCMYCLYMGHILVYWLKNKLPFRWARFDSWWVNFWKICFRFLFDFIIFFDYYLSLSLSTI